MKGIGHTKSTWLISLALISVLTLAAIAPTTKYFEIARNLDIFTSIFKEVNAQYVDEVKPEKLVRKGITGMLEALDPYTDFIAEEEAESFRISTTGQYAGIGALVGEVKGKLIVTHPYEEYPAFQAGIRVGDEIVSIDNTLVAGKEVSQVSNLLKGQPKTTVKVIVRRANTPDLIEFSVVRQKIAIRNVSCYLKLNTNIGYIKLDEFTQGASKEVIDAFKELKNQSITSLVLDLRDNPGGLLHEAVNISNIFLPKNTLIVETKGRADNSNAKFFTLNAPLDTTIPILVLVNEGSASASEIVAGALQDHDRAILIGSQTFGKGLVQVTKPLAYNTQLKITTARYYIPSGRCIQSVNYTVRNKDGTATRYTDSIKVEYKTIGGRTVYADNGLTPDIIIKQQTYPALLNQLIEEGYFFDFVTYFANSQIKTKNTDPEQIEISDATYVEFVNWLKKQGYKYKSPLTGYLSELKKAIQKDKLSEELRNHLNALQATIEKQESTDLDKHKKEVKHLLAQQVAFHLHFNKGLFSVTLPQDPLFIQAKTLVEDKSTFLKILSQK
jgi:carboxyl-terminal processing protease